MCLYTLMRGPTNKPFAAALHEPHFILAALVGFYPKLFWFGLLWVITSIARQFSFV